MTIFIIIVTGTRLSESDNVKVGEDIEFRIELAQVGAIGLAFLVEVLGLLIAVSGIMVALSKILWSKMVSCYRNQKQKKMNRNNEATKEIQKDTDRAPIND